jgi:hypothetical protein
MSSYQVTWRLEAEDSLASLWVADSADKEAIRRASVLIDRLLSTNPKLSGTAISEGLWGINAHPLRAIFTVDDAARRVEVVIKLLQ